MLKDPKIIYLLNSWGKQKFFYLNFREIIENLDYLNELFVIVEKFAKRKQKGKYQCQKFTHLFSFYYSVLETKMRHIRAKQQKYCYK